MSHTHDFPLFNTVRKHFQVTIVQPARKVNVNFLIGLVIMAIAAAVGWMAKTHTSPLHPDWYHKILLVPAGLSCLIALGTKNPFPTRCNTMLFKWGTYAVTLGWVAFFYFIWPESGYGKAMFICILGMVISFLNWSEDHCEFIWCNFRWFLVFMLMVVLVLGSSALWADCLPYCH